MCLVFLVCQFQYFSTEIYDFEQFVGSIGGYMMFLLNASQLAIVCGLGGLSALLHFEVPAARRANSKCIHVQNSITFFSELFGGPGPAFNTSGLRG